MTMSVEHRLKFAALRRQWWRLHMSEKFSSWTNTHKQTNRYEKKNQHYVRHYMYVGGNPVTYMYHASNYLLNCTFFSSM